MGQGSITSFTFAGLWDEWKGRATGETLKSCTMIVTKPNDLAAEIHDRMPVMLERADFASWLNFGGTTLLKPAANRLPKQEVGAMIDRVIANQPLPANIRQEIIERTDGIPLFVEEMTKALLEAGDERGATQTVAAVPSATLAVPATLHASLMARA